MTLQGHTRSVSAVAVTPHGRHVVSGSADNTLRVWDLKDGRGILTFVVDALVTARIVAQDNRTIVAGDGFGRLHFQRLVEADETKPSIGDTKIVSCIARNRKLDLCNGLLSVTTIPLPSSRGFLLTSALVADFRNERGTGRTNSPFFLISF